jgi:2,5-diamino-6-(ribosylamino)-4(3H)-pyrimidinone 5'-phosphate reductase
VFTRLLPDPASDLSAGDVAGGLHLGDLAPADRPYLVLNMASTADGRVAIGGRSAPVAGSADRELFHHLRTQGDAVMAGAGTVRAERYRRLTKTEELRRKREREGVFPEPLAVFVSGRLDLPADLPILQDPDSHVAIVTAVDEKLEGVQAGVTYLLEPVTRELAPAMHRLRTELGVRSIVCEGGPHLNSSLLREGLADELFLCVSPRIAGDPEQLASVEGVALPQPLDLELVSLHEAEQHLFLRYRIGR